LILNLLSRGRLVVRPPHEVSAMVIQGDTVWTGGDEGVYAINRKNGSLIKQLQANPELKHVRALLVDEKGQLWIGHQFTKYQKDALDGFKNMIKTNTFLNGDIIEVVDDTKFLQGAKNLTAANKFMQVFNGVTKGFTMAICSVTL
jgi:ligand-binding sensor domain-containing protein